MEYTTEYDEMNGICIVCVKGQHKLPQDALVLQQFARDFDEEQNCQRFLFDMRQAEIIGGTMDIFKAGTVPVDTDHKQRRHKVALLYDSVSTDQKFLEDVSLNRGYQLRVFDDYNKAMEWIMPKS